MDQKLSRCLIALKEETEAAQRGAPAEAAEVISDISRLCDGLVTDEDISLAIAAIFDLENGVFSVLDTLLHFRDRSTQKARESCLNFVADFVKRIELRAAPYATLIKEKCVDMFRRDESKAAQAAALAPLVSLLELSMRHDGSLKFCLDWTTAEVFLLEYRKVKSTGTLKSNILVVLGLAVECFPRSFEEWNVHTILKLCLDTLDEQLHQKGKDLLYVLVAGAVKCLDSLLTFFDKSLPAGGSVDSARRVYAYLEQVIYFREDLKRYEMVKAGLQLLSRHASLFRLRLLEHSMNILKWLQAYCTHVNAQLRDAALPAFNQFISEVAICLASDDHRIRNAQEVYKRLIAPALGILDSQESNSKLISLAIRTVGKFSPLIVKFSGKESLQQSFDRLVSYGGNSLRSMEVREESLGFSVTLVGAFAEMAAHLDHIEDYMVNVIVEAVGNIFYGFPYLFPKQKVAVQATLYDLLKAFHDKGTVFSLLLSNIVWSSLERAVEPVKALPGQTEAELWRPYVALWSTILELVATRGKEGRSTEEDAEEGLVDNFVRDGCERAALETDLQAAIFDALLRCIIKLMTELNLKYRVKKTNIQGQQSTSERSEDLEVAALELYSDENPIEPLNDVHMKKFLNVVEFVLKLLSGHFEHFFLKWVYPFGHCLVELSNRYPLISGFYKLLAITIRIADRQSYFNIGSAHLATACVSKKEDMGHDNFVHDGSETLFEENRSICRNLFRRYLQEVLVSSRRYKLELLASCLRLCLSAPPSLIRISSLVEPLKSAFRMGIRFPPLAVVAMDALEAWHMLCPDELEPLLCRIVPCLSNYLYDMEGLPFNTEIALGKVPEIFPTDLKGNVSQAQLRHIKATRMKEAQPDAFELIQVRIQSFLGRIGRYGHFLVPDLDLLQVTGTGGLAWDTVDRVKFTIPFRDDKPDVWLDPLLPRVVDLALSASDRRTKVIACELLHALCLLLLGNAAKGPARQQNDEAQSVHYENIYRRIFPAVIRLASDVEQVTRELFSRLVMQLIHWFTANVKKENPDTMALLDSILEGLADGENGSLREFCAECFEEFMRWSVRHTPPEVDNFINITSMLRRLYNRLDHPNPYHRFGAAMATSRIYRVLRDNKLIVDRHILELLFFCIKSLRVGEADNEQIGTVKLMGKVLEDLFKLVSRNASSLLEKRKDRPMFLALDEFLEWLFKETGNPQERCRTKCMWLFGSICKVLPVGSSADWFRLYIGPKKLKDVLNDFDIKLAMPRGKQSRSSIADMKCWMAHLSCCLNWFEWALKSGLISLKELPLKKGTNSLNISSAIADFLESLSVMQNAFVDRLLTPAELEADEGIRYMTVMYLLTFLKEVLYIELGIKECDVFISPQQIQHLPDEESYIIKLLPLKDPNFHHLMCSLLLLPRKVGFISIQPQKAEELARAMMKTIQMLTIISSVFKSGMVKSLRDLLLGGRPDFDFGALNVLFEGAGTTNHMFLEDARCLLKGYQQLSLAGLLIPIVGRENADHMGKQLLNTVFSIRRECPPVLESLALEMLSLSVAFGVKAPLLLELVFDQKVIISPRTGNTKVTAGSIFYLNFRKFIVQQVKFSYKDCLLLLLKEAPENPTARLLVSAVLDDYIRSRTDGSTITMGSFLKEFLDHLMFLRPCCTFEATVSDKLFFLEVLHKLMVLDSQLNTVLSPIQPSFQFILDNYFSLLSGSSTDGSSSNSGNYPSKHTTFVVQSNALILIPYFFRSSIGNNLKSHFTSALTKIVTDHLLVREADLPAGSNQRTIYIQMLNRLLEAVCSSESLELLEVLFPLFQSPTKLSKRRILEVLKAYVEKIGDRRGGVCDFCLEVLRDGTKVPCLRQAVIEYVFIPVMNAAPSDFILTWYAKHIKEFMIVLGKHADHAQLSAEIEQDYLVLRICHYLMIELLFSKGDVLSIKDKVTPVVSNQQLMQMATSDSRAKNDPAMYLFPENSALWKNMHIAAYNCLAAIVMCTQDQEKIYTILFKDFAGKPLWQHLVDCNKVYDNFPVETSQLEAAQGVIRGLQSERRSLKKPEGVPSSLSSQYIISGTLSQDPVVIDTFVGSEVHNKQTEGETHEASQKEGGTKHDAEELVEIEALDQDDFDQHPCMPVVLKLIEHLYFKFGDAHRHSFEMPEWMKALQSTLANAGTPVNICLFLSKVIIKARKVFTAYASHWFRPFVQAILRDPERSGGNHFHYLLRDMCITILEWRLPAPPDSNIASSFVNHLMVVAPHGSRQVLQANLEIIRLFLSCWKSYVNLDRNIIAAYLNAGGKSPISSDKTVILQRTVGLQLLGAVVAAGLPFCDDVDGSLLSERELCKSLLSSISYKMKIVYEASAELLGILVKQWKELQPHIYEQFLETPLKQRLLALFREGEIGQFLNIMDKITMRFPLFLEGYSSMIFDLLPRVHGVFKIIALNIILRCPASVPDLPSMALPFLSKILTHHDELAQLKSLLLVAELVKDIAKQTVSEQVLPMLSETFATHESVDCRQQYYQVLDFLYNVKEMKDDKLLRKSLLLGLCDNSGTIRESVHRFWHTQLSRDLRQRFVQMIKEMYDPAIEDHWAQSVNSLLLKLCEDSVDFKRTIFSAPLSDCEFKEYTFGSSLLSGTMPMTPMFSDTQNTATQGLSQVIEEDVEPRAARQAGMIRATVEQSQSLDLTQSQGFLSTYTSSGTETSLLAMSQKEGSMGKNTLRQEGGALIDTSTKLKRRIFHSSVAQPQVIRGVFNAMKRREARAVQQALERTNKVHMMRRYRIGELPDIEIKHEEIIGPMVALGERDSTFSRLLLTILCRSIYSLPPNGIHETEQELKATVNRGIQSALEKTQNKISFVGCALSLCLEDKEAWIKPKLVGSASIKSSNYQSGILLLENALLRDKAPWHFFNNTNKRHRGPGGQVTREPGALEEAWLELAHLYKSVGEDDVVLSIYKRHLTKATTTHHALEAQLGGNTIRALELYVKAINQFDELEGEAADNPSDVEQDVWWSQRLVCMADLLDWRGVMEEIIFQVGESNLQRLWEPRLQDLYLNCFVKASIKMPTHHSMLTDFLQESSQDVGKRERIINDFGSQMATLSVISDQFDQARFYIHQCNRNFRKHWTEIHPLITSARHAQVRQLQKTIELDEFIDLATRGQQLHWPRLISKWRTRWPSTNLDDVETWDDIVQNRLLYFQKFQSLFNSTLEKGNEEEGRQFASKLDVQRANVYYEAAKGLMKQGAYDVAKVYMNQFLAVRGGSSEKEKLDYKAYKNIVKLRCLQAQRVSSIDVNKATEMLHQVLAYIQSTGQKVHQQNQFHWQNGLKLLEGNAYAQLAWLTLRHIPQPFADTDSVSECLKLLGAAFDAYSSAFQEIKDMSCSSFSSRAIGKASLKFAFFCDELLTSAKSMKWGNQIHDRLHGVGSSAGLPPVSIYPTLIVKHIMKAVQFDSFIQAHQGVARVLTLVGQYNETWPEFLNASKKVPSWLFIAWIPQMLAVMDKEEGEIFMGILEDIAKLYPQALFFAFNVSKTDFGARGQNRTNHLAAALKSPALEGLIRALEDLTFPEQRLRDGLAQVKTHVASGNKKKAQESFCKLFEDCLDVEALIKENRQSGEYNLKFARDYSRRVVKALGVNGNKLLSMDEKQLAQAINDVMANLQKAFRTLQSGKMSLGSFSKWMAQFDQSKDLVGTNWVMHKDEFLSVHGGDTKGIEIPGKYGFQKPDPSLHVNLVGFDQTLVCLSSKQRPKVLKMRGSDEVEYKFVVKGGEDLRLDQRIEQLFEVMNSILQRDPTCSRRQLSVHTYAVIPVSKQCGLLQFVENTRVLEDVIKDGLACTLPLQGWPGKNAPTEVLFSLKNKFQEWLEKRGVAQNLVDCYKKMYSKVERDEIENKMNSFIVGLPWDALKTGLFRLTTSAESFLALRSQYERSLAVLSICGYIAGVGDRHLANTLVDTKNGSLVPIDFGYSFGTGVILLPVPELIPFRMTNQLTNVLLPQDAVGLLRNDMIHTMSALQANKNVISAVMDIFVKEPLVDWKTEAMKTAAWRNPEDTERKVGAVDVSEKDVAQANHEQQHVELKIENAHRKLDLWNPADITVAELQTSIHANKPYMQDLEQIVRGHPEHNVRARILGTVCESVQEQVDCLIDQATDPNLLGRIWIGWQPWV